MSSCLPNIIHEADVLIIGASIAGSSLALRLAKAGVRCTLIDKAKFPRRKACGEGLSCVGTALLHELGITPNTGRIPAQSLNGYCLWSKGQRVQVPYLLEAEKDHSLPSYGIQRYHLDHALLQEAQTYGAAFLLGQQVRSIERSPGLVEVSIPAGRVRAKCLVLADGANSLLAESIGARSLVHKDSRFAYSMIVNGSCATALHEVHIILRPGFEICCTPLGQEALNVSLLLPAQEMSKVHDSNFLEQTLQLVKEHTGFGGQLAASPRAPLGVGPLNRSRRGGFHDGVFLIGDCCETLDPIGGMGMTHALLSSKLAAQALAEHLHAGISLSKAGEAYEAALLREMRPLRGFTRLTYFFLKKVAPTPLFVPLGNSALPRELGRVAHRTSGDSALTFCSQLLLSISGSLL